MSLIRLGFWAASGAGSASYWLSLLGGTGSDYAWGIATDSGNNSYAGGHSYTGSSDDFLIAKRDSDGAIGWQRNLGSSGKDQCFSVAIDSADNAYFAGVTNSIGAGGDDAIIAKYNSAGVIQWQRVFGGSNTEQAYSVATDSSNNVYIAGITTTTGGRSDDYLLVKYNSGGTLQFQKSYHSGGEKAEAVGVDSSDNVYLIGDGGTLVKTNNAGTIQWQRKLDGVLRGKGISFDSSDNVFVAYEYNPSGKDFLLAKYNSSGSLQWQRTLTGASDEISQAVTVDSFGNCYVFGSTASEGVNANGFLAAKYSSAGVIQWQRVLGSSGNDFGYGASIDSDNNLHLVGRTSSAGTGSNDFFHAKLPNDGSLTGTYELDSVNFVYAASTLTAATSTLSDSAGSMSEHTLSLTDNSSTLTDSTASATSYLVEL